jgi:Na+-driven multidrug efflux pump
MLNFGLDPPLIFGWGPLPAFGVMGAAMATLVTQGLATLAGVAIFLRGKHGIHLRRRDLVPDLAYIRRAFFLGFPGSVELSTRALGLMVMSFLVASFGTLPTAVYGHDRTAAFERNVIPFLECSAKIAGTENVSLFQAVVVLWVG